MNHALSQMLQQRKIMEIWAIFGSLFIATFGGFTIFGLNTGMKLDLAHPAPIFAVVFVTMWSLFGMTFSEFCALRK